jgi:FkbM family methyltransferase
MSIFFRSYEPSVTQFLKKKCLPGMTVYDVGAHVGIHAIYCARLLHERGNVYAFEAWPDNFEALEKNIALNEITMIHTVQKIVADRDVNYAMTAGRKTTGMHHIAQKSEIASFMQRAITLDMHWRTTRHNPSIIIIDVEGEENRVLSGSEDILKRCKPALIIEYHDSNALSQLLTHIESCGYNKCYHNERHLFAEAIG